MPRVKNTPQLEVLIDLAVRKCHGNRWVKGPLGGLILFSDISFNTVGFQLLLIRIRTMPDTSFMAHRYPNLS